MEISDTKICVLPDIVLTKAILKFIEYIKKVYIVKNILRNSRDYKLAKRGLNH